ncbi:hypothetical protein CDD83_2738 [Cordyceps sp. RAO-2017]|nr:hypothetical protein CDD83_2738 [Cordyceps sp. RAO-2017]
MSQVMGWILAQVPSPGQHSTVVAPASVTHLSPLGQQKRAGRPLAQEARPSAAQLSSALANTSAAGTAEATAVRSRRRSGSGSRVMASSRALDAGSLFPRVGTRSILTAARFAWSGVERVRTSRRLVSC